MILEWWVVEAQKCWQQNGKLLYSSITKRISSLSSGFIQKGDIIRCVENGSWRYSDLVQGKLKIVCVIHFTSKNKKAGITQQLIQPSLIIKVDQQLTMLLTISIINKVEVKLEKDEPLRQQSTVDTTCVSSNSTDTSVGLTRAPEIHHNENTKNNLIQSRS